jgi:hypothetical protein
MAYWSGLIRYSQDARGRYYALLADVSSKGVFVSTHPEVIAKIGTKEVLYRTAKMSRGCDTRLYTKLEAMRAGLPESLGSGDPRVLKCRSRSAAKAVRVSRKSNWRTH